jgi:trimeric autotransporter adhesin
MCGGFLTKFPRSQLWRVSEQQQGPHINPEVSMRCFFVIGRFFSCLLALTGAAFAQQQFITTVAGSPGGGGFAGDGGLAVQAQLSAPGSVAMDANGNLYIADVQNQRIRKVSSDGIITTVAGNGQRGFTPDGVNATDAALDLIKVIDTPPLRPYVRARAGIAVDQEGNLYIADTNNHRIRRVGHDGVIRTVAGSGVQGYAGDDGPALEASLSNPAGVFVGRNHEI